MVTGPAKTLRFLHEGERVDVTAVPPAERQSAGRRIVIELRGVSARRTGSGPTSSRRCRHRSDIARNEYVALTGASGSGKSTMMNILGCLDTPSTGTYTLDGEAVAGLNEDQLAARAQSQDRLRLPELLPDAARRRPSTTSRSR